VLTAALGREAVPERSQRSVILQMLDCGVNAPWTSSVGRLFDAVASIAGVADESLFEGQAAMLLERQIDQATDDAYPLRDGDWSSMIEAVHRDKLRGEGAPRIAARFHNALANWIVQVATQTGVLQVALSGGVFQNGYLVERTAALLETRGFQVYTHQQVPTNDGGIALGQAVIAAMGQGV